MAGPPGALPAADPLTRRRVHLLGGGPQRPSRLTLALLGLSFNLGSGFPHLRGLQPESKLGLGLTGETPSRVAGPERLAPACPPHLFRGFQVGCLGPDGILSFSLKVAADPSADLPRPLHHFGRCWSDMELSLSKEGRGYPPLLWSKRRASTSLKCPQRFWGLGMVAERERDGRGVVK